MALAGDILCVRCHAAAAIATSNRAGAAKGVWAETRIAGRLRGRFHACGRMALLSTTRQAAEEGDGRGARHSSALFNMF